MKDQEPKEAPKAQTPPPTAPRSSVVVSGGAIALKALPNHSVAYKIALLDDGYVEITAQLHGHTGQRVGDAKKASVFIPKAVKDGGISDDIRAAIENAFTKK